MFTRFLTFVFFFVLLKPVLAQNVEELLDQIDLKLRKDKKYLNIHYINFPNNRIDATLKNLPRTNFRENFSFEAKDNIMYNVIFLKDAVGIDSIVVLSVEQITDRAIGGERLFGETTGPVIDTERVLIYKDLYSLSRQGHPGYNTLYTEVRRFLRENPENPPSSLLRINPDVEIKTSLGIASRDNTDFLNFQRANNLHWYPKAKVVQKATGRRSATVVADSTPDYRIDAGFSGITLSHKYMDFNIGSASAEIGVEERSLNLLPFQQMAVVGGFRTLLNISNKKDDYDNSLIIDARFLGRVPANFAKLAINLPFMGAAKPRLHLGMGGGLDLSISRAFGLPFINLYLIAGAEPDMSNSSTSVITRNGKRVTYYNTMAGEATMSFYWNSSVSMVTRFRLDVGIGTYDVYEAVYATTKLTSKPAQKILAQSELQPIVAFNFNFAPDGQEIYHAQVRLYDSQIKVSGWLKIFEMAGGHVFRFGGEYVTPPIARKKDIWEQDGGAMIQIRYRYGF